MGTVRLTIDDAIDGFRETERLLFDEPNSWRLKWQSDHIKEFTSRKFRCLCAVELAHKGDRWLSRACGTEPTEPSLANEAHILAMDGPRVVEARSGNSCWIVPFGDGWNMYAYWNYFQFMGFNAAKFVAASGGTDYESVRKLRRYRHDLGHPFLPDALVEHRAKYSVLSEPKIVDGRECWVIERPRMDRMLVDPSRGFAILRRAYCWGPTKPRRLKVRQSDWREVRPGLWVPWSQTVDQYGWLVRKMRAWRNKVINRTRYSLMNFDFDNVDDDCFNLRLPRRSRVFDFVGDPAEPRLYSVLRDDFDPLHDAVA